MRILIAHAPTEGGTAVLAQLLAFALRAEGFDTLVHPAAAVDDLDGIDAAVIGGGCATGRWHRDAHRFVRRHRARLAALPVWLFSCGASEGPTAVTAQPPVTQLTGLRDRIGARGCAWLPMHPPGGFAAEDDADQPALHLGGGAAYEDPTVFARRIATELHAITAGVR